MAAAAVQAVPASAVEGDTTLVTDIGGLHKQRPPVLVEQPTTAVTAGSARWTVPAAAFDKSGCRFDAAVFAKMVSMSGRAIALDACAPSGAHALADNWCSATHSFLQQDCSGQHVWLDPPTDQAVQYLQHYIACKEKQPATTSALLVLPKEKQLQAKIAPLLHGMRLLKTFSRGTRLYNAVSGCRPQPGVPYAVQVWYDPPASLAAGTLVSSGEELPTVTVQSDSSSVLRFTCHLAGCATQFRVDTEATHSFVAAHFVERAGLAVTPAARTVALADGQTVQVQGVCRARIQIGSISDVCTFLVLRLDPTYNVLLGQDWLQRRSAVLDFGQGSMTVSVKDTPVVVPAGGTPVSTTSGGGEKYPRISALQLKRLARKPGTELFLVIVRPVDQPDERLATVQLSSAVENDSLIPKKRLQKILDKYKKVFAELPGGVIHRPGLPEMTIDFEADKQPPVGYQYRLSRPEREELQRQLTMALEKGWIEPSSAPYGAPVLFAKKKGGGLRMCIDYRAANAITIKNRYPLPRIDDLLDQLNGATVFSGLDLAAGYWQIPIQESHRERSTMRTPLGAYQWKVMPFGLTNAPAVFARTMQQVFHDMIGKFVLVYLDDILIFSKTPEEHEKHLDMVLKRLEEHKFYAQLHKCHFALPEVEFLGHMVSKEGIRVDPRKVQIVKDWPVPANISELRSFLGLANYFRRFIHAFSTIARPLHALTRKEAVWHWSTACQSAFELLKEKLTAAPVLAAPDFSKPFEVVADASDFTLGAILLQEGRPVAFESRKLTSAECNYHTPEKELLAVMHALNIWRCYLDGSRFTIFSDHEPLKYLRTKASLLPREVRWSQFIERFDYSWEYREGRINAADPLSRARHAPEGGSGTGSITSDTQYWAQYCQ